MNHKNIDVELFEIEPKTIRYKLPQLLFGSFLFGLLPPNVVRLKGKPLGSGDIPLPLLGKAVGFTNEFFQKKLANHQKQIQTHIVLVIFILVVTFIAGFLAPIIFFLVKFFPSLLLILNSSAVVGALYLVLFSALYFLSFYITIALGMKLATVTVNRFFSESLCILASLQIIFSLNQDDVLAMPNEKSTLLHLTNFLDTHIALLASHYSRKNNHNKEWIKTHFGNLALFIRERERWIVAPRENTLTDLRKDFYALSEMFVTGRYGDFEWGNIGTYSPPETKKNTLARNILRFLGIIFPASLFILYFVEPDLFGVIGLNQEVISIVLISWLLLSMDSFFGLGVISSFAQLVKSIKELV